MLSFLSLSTFLSPSPVGQIVVSDSRAESDFWPALVALGFTQEVVEESFGVLDARRWEAASKKLGEQVQYLDVTGQDEQGIAYWQPGNGSFFVEVMQQFSDALLTELDALAVSERALPALQRAADRHSHLGEVEKAIELDRQIEGGGSAYAAVPCLNPCTACRLPPLGRNL